MACDGAGMSPEPTENDTTTTTQGTGTAGGTAAGTPGAEGKPLAGKVALVAGATRGGGRGIAVALGEAGATVYGTGRTTRTERSEYGRDETIEETAEMVTAAGGTGIAVQVDHTDPAQVEALVKRIDADHGRLDVLVNDIWGGDPLAEWDKPIWGHDLAKGLRIVRLGLETHMITSHFALPLLVREPGGLVVEVTDGTDDYNRANYRINAFYDLVKVGVIRLAYAQGTELAPHGGTAVALTPGWLRSEMMLDIYGVTEENWQDATRSEVAPDDPDPGHFIISESPRYVGRAVAALAADPDRARWNRQSLSSGQLAQVYGFTDIDGSRPDAWRYLVEVQDAGKPADATGYR
jgi:NAD(P)-dependent dehydrogenase (short-subunit alcohol dehydrogenase family)